MLRVMMVSVGLCCAGWLLGCSDGYDFGPFEEDGAIAHDAAPVPRKDAGEPQDATMMMTPSTGGAPGVPRVDASTLPSSGLDCVLSVAAPCDGPEDCPVPQSCCALFDPTRGVVSYTKIGCALSCDGPNEFELCHPEQGCTDPTRVCRRSAIVPYDFFTVCAPPALFPLSIRHTSREVADRVLCGGDQCVVGVEQCCLRNQFDYAKLQSVPLDPYCAPLGSECSCDSSPPDATDDEDGGMIMAR